MAEIRLDNPADPRLRPFLGLRNQVERVAREQPGGDMAHVFIGEGDVVIARAIRAGERLLSVLFDAARPTPLLGTLPVEVDRFACGPEVLAAISGRTKLRDPIGCFMRPAPAPVGELLAHAQTVAVLEGVANPTNMGVIARSAAAMGCDALLVDRTSVDPLARRCVRTSMGEVFAIPHAQVGPIDQALAMLVQEGFTVAALTPSPQAQPIGSFTRSAHDRVAILLGTEGIGLTDQALAAATVQLRIPMAAEVDSLNVASAAAVAFHALGHLTSAGRP